MENLALVLICLVLGLLIRNLSRFPKSSPQTLNQFAIYISYPALVLVQITTLLRAHQLGSDMIIPISMPWITFGLSAVIFGLLGKKFGWSNQKIGALTLVGGLGNTSFIGFPLLQAFIGPEAIRIGVVLDQLGSFLVLSTAGIIVGSYYGGADLSPRKIAMRILTFPPFAALILAVVWHMTGTDAPGFVTTVLEKISLTLVPVALVAVGFQLSISKELLAKRKFPLLCGLVFKLVFLPLFFIVLYVYVFGQNGFNTRVTLLEAAMASMITSAIVSTELNLDAEIANLLLGVGILISLITVPLWNMVINRVLGI